MTRFLALTLTSAMALSLAACGGKTADNTTVTETSISNEDFAANDTLGNDTFGNDAVLVQNAADAPDANATAGAGNTL